LETPISELSAHIRAKSQPSPDLHSPEAFAAHFDSFADAKIVLLGEATHGTAEFYRARAAITHRLVERHAVFSPSKGIGRMRPNLTGSSAGMASGANAALSSTFRAGCGETANSPTSSERCGAGTRPARWMTGWS
jgi:hypothetical protein